MIQRPDYLPENYKRIVVVDNLYDVFNAQMEGKVNCVLYPRQLEGDFDGLAKLLDQALKGESQSPLRLHKDLLQNLTKNLNLTPAQFQALEGIIEDMDRAGKETYSVSFRVVRPKVYESIIYRFHEDGAYKSEFMKRVLSVYNGAVTEYLCNHDAVRDEGWDVYDPKPDAKIHTFKPGDIWQHKCLTYPKHNEQAFIHRAPRRSGAVPSLVLVCDFSY